MLKRPRRNRKSDAIRNLLQETRLSKNSLIFPLFVKEGAKGKEAIDTMPHIYRFSISEVLKEVESLHKKGLNSFLLFPFIEPALKDAKGTTALKEKDILPQAIKAIKKHFPKVLVFSDVALDPYTSHGHDGIIDENGYVLNDETVEILSKMALIHAEAGADVISPSDMMDGRVKAIRETLEKHQHKNVNIMSYAAKYASSLYGPFRDALGSCPQFGDKKSYQLNPANVGEALLEAALDEEEGADLLLVKPATLYLDVIHQIKQNTQLPVGAYHVSGEYAMVMAGDKAGMLDKNKVFIETFLSVKRAGADFIISYAVPQIIDFL